MRSRRSESRLSSTSPPYPTCSISLQGTFESSRHNKDISSLFLQAWKNLRFRHPSITAYDAILKDLVQESAALKRWATDTLHVVEDKIADEHIANLRLGSFATLTYLPKSNGILFDTAHCRTDGIGVLMLIDPFLTLATDPTLPDPNVLPWVHETSALTPTVEFAARIPSVPTDAIKTLAQQYTETFHQAVGAAGLPSKGEATTLIIGTRSSRLIFSPSETYSVVASC